jgi:hypothetical protein
MASVQSAAAMQTAVPPLPPNITQQQVQEVFAVRLPNFQCRQTPSTYSYVLRTNDITEISAHETAKST